MVKASKGFGGEAKAAPKSEPKKRKPSDPAQKKVKASDKKARSLAEHAPDGGSVQAAGLHNGLQADAQIVVSGDQVHQAHGTVDALCARAWSSLRQAAHG